MIGKVVKTVGVVGAGGVSFKLHLPLLLTMGIGVPWVIDQSRTRAQAAADAYGIRGCLTPEQIDEVTPTDVVLIACPYGTRQSYFKFFTGKPSALYIEKPVARTVAELNQICSLRAPHEIAAGFLRRSMGVTNIMRDVIRDRIFGRLRHIRSEFGAATVASSGAAFTKDVRLAGGGQLFESAIHNIDGLCFMTDATSARLKRVEMIHEELFDLHTDATVELVDPEGNAIDMELLVTCLHHTSNEIVMQFDQAVITFSLFKPGRPQVRSRLGKRTFHLLDAVAKDYPRDVFDVTYAFWSDFISGLEDRRENYTNATKTRVGTLIIEQLYGHCLNRAPAEIEA